MYANIVNSSYLKNLILRGWMCYSGGQNTCCSSLALNSGCQHRSGSSQPPVTSSSEPNISGLCGYPPTLMHTNLHAKHSHLHTNKKDNKNKALMKPVLDRFLKIRNQFYFNIFMYSCFLVICVLFLTLCISG